MNYQNLLYIALFYLAIVNVVTFLMYGIDKAASKRAQKQTHLSYAEREQARTHSKEKAKKPYWRIPETKLLTMAVLGGSIGAWLGMKVWHHKTLHKKFKYGVPAIIILQLALIGYFLYEQ